MDKKDGGPAFLGQLDHGKNLIESWAGMTLRDFFAAKALQGWLAGPCGGITLDEYEGEDAAFAEHQAAVAVTCYSYADAMIAERAKDQP